MLVPCGVVGSLTPSKSPHINLDAACIAVIQPLFLLRDALAEVLSRGKANVKQRRVAIDWMAAVNLVNTVVS